MMQRLLQYDDNSGAIRTTSSKNDGARFSRIFASKIKFSKRQKYDTTIALPFVFTLNCTNNS